MGVPIKKNHSTLGKVSLIFAILTIVLFVSNIIIVFAVAFTLNFSLSILSTIFSLLLFIFTILALILGAISYFGKEKDKYGLVGFIVGLVFLILMFVSIAIAATTYVYVSGLGSPNSYTVAPSVTFKVIDHSDNIGGAGDNLLILQHNGGDTIDLSQLSIEVFDEDNNEITLQTNAYYAYGTFSVGDEFIIKEGSYNDPVSSATTLKVRIIHTPSYSVLYGETEISVQ